MKNTQRAAPKIPDGMVELLKNLAKSILKEQPDDIYVFAAEYFENLVRQRDGGALDKGYGKFRKYDLEITQLNGIDVCPRCHCTLHPIRNELIEPPDDNAPSTSPKNMDAPTATAAVAAAAATAADEDGEMSVNGVAIKALPRDGKPSSKNNNNQKNRQNRLETIRSVSIDSAIDDDAKSQSPKSNEGSASEKKTDSGRLNTNADANAATDVNAKPKEVISTISEKTVIKGAAVAAGGAAAATAAAAAVSGGEEKASERVNRDDDMASADVPVSKTPPNEMHIEQISSLKTDDDADSSPNETTTTTTSVSEANTDRTVIEVGAPLNIESNEISKSEEIITVVTKPSDDQTNELDATNATANATNITDDVDNLQLSSAKHMDRLRTPESDSGLSEKSFNLAIHENAETITNEINDIKSGTKTMTTKRMTTMTVSESTVEKIQMKSEESDFDTHSKDDAAPSPSSSPSPTGSEKQSIVTESKEIKSIETIKTEKTEEITEMKKIEVKSATKHDIASTAEKIDTRAALTEEDLKESQKVEEMPVSPPLPTTAEKLVTVEQEVNQPEITLAETSKTVEISSESIDGKHVQKSVVEESSSSTTTVASSEQKSEDKEIITSHTQTKRASNENLSIDDEKPSVADENKEMEATSDSVDEQLEQASDSKTQIIEVDVDTHDSKTVDEAEKDGVEPTKVVEKEEPAKQSEMDEPTPTAMVSSSEKQTIETTESTQETRESSQQHQQIDVKSESVNLVTDTKTVDEPLQHTTISTEEKTKVEQKVVESESKHSQSEQVTTKLSEIEKTSETTIQSTEKDNEMQSDGIASEVKDLIGDGSNEAEIDEIDKTVILIDEKDESKQQNESNERTITTTTDRIEKITEQPADANIEKSRPESRDKDQTEKVTSSEKLEDETVSADKKHIEIETIKTAEQHTIVEDKSDTKSSKHMELSKTVEVEEAKKTPDEVNVTLSTSTDDIKKQDDEEHQRTKKIEEISTKEEMDEDESKSLPDTIAPPLPQQQHTVVQIVESEKIEKSITDETKEQKQQQQMSSTIQTNVVESVVKPIAAINTESEKISTQEKLGDKSNEKHDEQSDSNSWEKTTDQIAEYVHEHDGNQIKATAPLLTDITDDGSSSTTNVVMVDQQKESIETIKSDQTDKNEKITTSSINSEIVEVTVKKDTKNDDNDDNDIDKKITTESELDEKMRSNDDDNVKKDAVDDTLVRESKEIASSDLNVSINETNVMDEQGKENVATTETKTATVVVDDGVNQKEKETTTITSTSGSSKIESDSMQESKDSLKSVEIETKTTKQITIDPIATVIQTDVTESNEISPIDQSKTTIPPTVNNIDESGKICANVDLKETLSQTIETNKSAVEEEEKKAMTTTTTTTATIEKHEQNVIENNDPNLMKPENGSSAAADEVKENPAVENSNNSSGMNNNNNSATTELSAMPTTTITSSKVDVVTEVDSKNDESSSSSSSHEKVHTSTIETKSFIENEQRNANVVVAASSAVAVATAAAAAVIDNTFEIKSNINTNNDDVGSESSAKDEYEQAVTRSVGDDSEKELLNLSLNTDLESPHQANDSADSEQQQQITTVEIETQQPQQVDHDSIDVVGLKKVPMQPDSLDIVADSLDVSLEPSVEADSLNIDDSSEDKTRSARSIDAVAAATTTATTITDDKKLPEASDKSQDQMITIDDANQLPVVRDVLIEIENKIDGLEPPAEDTTTVVMGDIVAVDADSADNINDQMRNELNVLELNEKSALPAAKEVTLEISPKPSATMVIETTSHDKSDAKKDDETKAVDQISGQSAENDQLEKVSESKENVLVVESDDNGNIEIHQETSKSTEDMDHTIDTAQKPDIETVQATGDIVKSSVEIEKINEAQNVTDETDTKEPTPEIPTVAAAAAAAATAGALGTIIITETVTKTIKESETHHNEETKTMAMSETVVEHARTTDDNVDAKSNANDLPSSDFSDTETTTDKAEKMYTESGMDETSRDERDEVSEIENFDLSSCGEDSLEAMYYMIRKNEIIMDRHHKDATSTTTTKMHSEEEQRIGVSFPEKATDDLEQAVREVSGNKKVQIRSIGSMDSSMDDVVLKKMSSDSDELQLHVIPNSEIESSVVDGDGGSDSSIAISEPMEKRSVRNDKEQRTVNESTDDEYIHRSLVSMQKSSDEFDEAAAVAAAATVAALSFQTSQSDSQSDDQPKQPLTETDTFDDDMMPGNIERKILASSTDDSDMSTGGGGAGRLTKDNFNVSTAFEHMIRTDSITEESDTNTIESAATKIQAGARGFLTRRRNRRSDGSNGTSMSIEKVSSIGNAAIDKSLDSLFENGRQELHEETSSTAYSESFEESSERTHSRQLQYDQTIDSVDSEKVLGITEVKVEQRKADDDDAIEKDGGNEKVPDINIQGISEESATASKRRLMLQRGDAMQRNSSAEQQPQQDDKVVKKSTDDARAKNKSNVSTTKNSSRSIGRPMRRVLGVRQRSMPVQIDTQLIRILPKHLKKRVKSANSEKSSKQNVRRPSFF